MIWISIFFDNIVGKDNETISHRLVWQFGFLANGSYVTLAATMERICYSYMSPDCNDSNISYRGSLHYMGNLEGNIFMIDRERVIDIIQHPLNKFLWILQLECSHDVEVYSRRKPIRRFSVCPICHPITIRNM